MKRFLYLPLLALLVIPFLWLGCAQGPYKVNLTVEQEFTALAEQYEIWYQSAPADVQAYWKETVDPLLIQADKLLDQYNLALKSGGEPGAILSQLNLLKTQILMYIAEKHMPE